MALGVCARARGSTVGIGSEGGILGCFMTCMSLFATMVSAATLSLGRSVSTCTTIGPTLLLLLGKFGVSQLVLHSAKLIGLRALTTAASGTFLLKGECGCLYNPFQLQVLDFIGGPLAENLSYDLHHRRELAEDNHGLHRDREVKASIFEIHKVAQHLCDCRSGMGASRDGS